jgi:hypothetical protein
MARNSRKYENRIRRLYKLTLQQLHEMYEDQFGRCAICERVGRVPGIKETSTRRLVVDHCHKTGAVRGLLCNSCNKALYMAEKRGWTRRAEKYLANHKKKAKLARNLARN